MSHFLVNNVATLPIIFQPINGGTTTATKMLEGTDDSGSFYENFNSSNTTAITSLYKHITPTKMMVGTQDLKDILIPIYTDLTGTFNTGDFEIPTWATKMAFLLIGAGGGGSGYEPYNFGGSGSGGGGGFRII